VLVTGEARCEVVVQIVVFGVLVGILVGGGGGLVTIFVSVTNGDGGGPGHVDPHTPRPEGLPSSVGGGAILLK